MTEVETPSINCESLEITVCCEPCHSRLLPVGLMCSSRQACSVEHLMLMYIRTFLWSQCDFGWCLLIRTSQNDS